MKTHYEQSDPKKCTLTITNIGYQILFETNWSKIDIYMLIVTQHEQDYFGITFWQKML
jgi:hypothetical protein